jgi:hypothetical protein
MGIWFGAWALEAVDNIEGIDLRYVTWVKVVRDTVRLG